MLAGASWMGEYGNPDDPKDWAFISQYSPYQKVAKGVKYLGQKHLVRIDSVSRSSAAATIVGEPDDGDQPEEDGAPRKRTRGRRGGRGRRSKAAAE